MKNFKDPFEYLTTDELIEEYPLAAKMWEWTTHRLRIVSEMGYIEYKYNNSIKRFVFRRGSIEKSIKYLLKRNRDEDDDLLDSLDD
jgi:hypothetical protein